MKKHIVTFVVLALASSCVAAQVLLDDVAEEMSLKADRIAVDNVTKEAVATGHVEAVYGNITLRGEKLERDADGVIRLDESCSATTCTNAPGHTHWNVSGEVELKTADYVILRDAWLEFFEIPVVYLPYFWYPLDTDCGFSWMVGWTEQWGAYVLTKTRYHLLGDAKGGDEAYWLRAATLVDFRERPSLGLGEDFEWSLSRFGRGAFSFYHAWDKDRYNENSSDAINQGTSVGNRRYGIGLRHEWYPTERDAVRLRGTYYSDSYYSEDFTRQSFFTLPTAWHSYGGNEIVWEHFENAWGSGVSVSGPLNEFYSGLARLPEVYFDFNPTPIFDLPINYESDTRFGYLVRQTAEFQKRMSIYSYRPGIWADFETFRADTYHRLTAPFKLADDVLSVVPRFAYHGTYWNAAGGTDLEGRGNDMPGSKSGGELLRTVVEGGLTFSARGSGWLNETWQHMFEPYADFLAQEAMFAGMGSGVRPYVFDGIENSMAWEDQFLNRGRNLPYSYYGMTPGIRQVWSELNERGVLKRVFEVDFYAGLQVNQASWYGNDELHKLAEAGSPNYGDGPCLLIPGTRARWTPDDDLTAFGSIEGNTESGRIAFGNLGFQQICSETFQWKFIYAYYDARRWDYSSSPYHEYRGSQSHFDTNDMNRYLFHMATLSFEYQPLDWLKFGPEIYWDLQEGEVGEVVLFCDYLTDCLGFRFSVAHRNKYITYDGNEHKEDFHIGFLIYLRALGDGVSESIMDPVH